MEIGVVSIVAQHAESVLGKERFRYVSAVVANCKMLALELDGQEEEKGNDKPRQAIDLDALKRLADGTRHVIGVAVLQHVRQPHPLLVLVSFHLNCGDDLHIAVGADLLAELVVCIVRITFRVHIGRVVEIITD